MSTHEVLVVRIVSVTPHPNADNLDLITISGYDYSIIARKGEFISNSLGIYIEPDYEVPTNRSEFAFLDSKQRGKKYRITTRRLRGLWSDGLLIPAPSQYKEGDNVINDYGISRWEPKAPRGFHWGNEGSDLQLGYTQREPQVLAPKYDLENFRKYNKLIGSNEMVYYTTKIHGANGRFTFHDGEMYVGSRTTWKIKPGTVLFFENNKTGEKIEKIAPECSWWAAVEQNPWIEEFCRNNPDVIVYGEIFGESVQGTKFHYGYKGKNVGLRIFDVLENGVWLSFHDLYTQSRFSLLKFVPVLYRGLHDKYLLDRLVEEMETSLEGCGDNHVREGIVIKLQSDQFNEKIGRIALKCVGRGYLQKS